MPRPTATVATNLQHNLAAIHDDTTTLECRIYHPHSLAASPRAPPWRKHAAVVAHPYASLGGCYDDAVVETISAALLRQGFVVGTFNFRGAGASTGRTSWTGRAEKGDYASFVGFVYYYVHYLDPFRPQKTAELRGPTGSAETSPVGTTSTSASLQAPGAGAGETPVLLLCGYSYGAMVTKLLPPLDVVLESFKAPKTASAAADIRLRAQHLAGKQNTILATARAAALAESPMSPRKGALAGLRIGGDEDMRRSQEHSRRSFSLDAEEKIRKGVAELMQKAKSHQLGHHKKSKEHAAAVKHESVGGPKEKEPDSLTPVRDLFAPRVAYLLVSPPVGWATHLMTLNLGGFLGRRSKPSKPSTPAAAVSGDSPDSEDSSVSAENRKLLDNPTLAIYGDSDIFVGSKKFREWAGKRQSAPGSQFRAHEISTAGHFYAEEGTMQRVADAVGSFARDLVASGPHPPAVA